MLSSKRHKMATTTSTTATTTTTTTADAPEFRIHNPSLAEQITTAESQETLNLVHKQGVLDTQQTEEVITAIATLNNKNVHKIVFDTPFAFTPLAAMRVLDSFLALDNAREVHFKVYGSVDSPGQKRLMQLLGNYKEPADDYLKLYKDFYAFRLFAAAAKKQRTLPVRAVERIQNFVLPQNCKLFRLE